MADYDFSHLGADDNFAAALLDQGRDGLGDAGGAARGVAPAVKVMAGDESMDAETALRRRQAVVAPLGGEDADQVWVVSPAMEDVERRLPMPISKTALA